MAVTLWRDCGPDLVYLPEMPFDLEKFIEDVHRRYINDRNVIIAVSEGIRDKDGKLISQYSLSQCGSQDAFGHVQLGGLASFLAATIKSRTGAKVRGIELSLLQRCAAHCSSKADIDEAFMAGKCAVESALNGETDKMVSFVRHYEDGKYVCKTALLPLNEVAKSRKEISA